MNGHEKNRKKKNQKSCCCCCCCCCSAACGVKRRNRLEPVSRLTELELMQSGRLGRPWGMLRSRVAERPSLRRHLFFKKKTKKKKKKTMEEVARERERERENETKNADWT